MEYLKYYNGVRIPDEKDRSVVSAGDFQSFIIFPFTTASRPALGPTQPPIQWVPEALSLGDKAAGA
jgi:hypothetical protein